MGYAGPGYGILSLVVSDKYIWCLDYKGGLYCSALPNAGLRWQKFEENVQQVAVSPSGWSASPFRFFCTWLEDQICGKASTAIPSIFLHLGPVLPFMSQSAQS